MEMNNHLRAESHVAQKNRRHKLRFQQNSGDLNHHQQPPPPPQHHHPPFSYNPNVFPSEMLNSVARNPHLLLPSGHAFVSHDDQDSCLQLPTSSPTYNANLPYQQQDCNNWKTVVNNTSQQHDHWNVVSNMSSGYGSYYQDVPFYHNSNNNSLQQDQVTLAQHSQTKNDNGMNNMSIPCWMNNSSNQTTTYNDHHRDQTTTATTTTTQGLSLSLSSVAQLKDDHHQQQQQPGQKSIKSDLLPNPDPKSVMGVSALAHSNIGPLGPFTGYATILKNSKYMKPAQQLLSKSCDVGFQELAQTCCSHDVYSHKILEEEMSWASDHCSVASYGAGLDDVHVSGRSCSGSESLRPEFHRKKAKLLYMQEEICRRYKQYLQQMQMVISSFETVAGLSEATPYVCLSLKAVSGHFHYVKDVISEQLSQMRKMVEEGMCSSTTTTGKAFDANVTSSSRLKTVDQRIGKPGGGGGSAGFFTSQQPVWRPQRGLPERAISVLKTWLFDHFLHPYPSDTDKHMLATQTGLTRNQVSNWFINARVRIWKPMVEEIHTLETKGNLADPNLGNPQLDGQDPSRMDMSSLSNTQQPAECSRNPGVNLTTVHEPHDQLRDHEKQARPEYQIPLSSMDRLMSIMPYPRSTFDASGLGPVSLTLGLRQNAEHAQQLQQHFGGQLIHDFVG